MKLTLGLVMVVFIFANVHQSVSLTDDEAMALHKNFTDSCIQSSPLTPEEIRRIKDDRIVGRNQPIASKNLQCFLLCYFEQVGLMDAKGKLKTSLLLQYLGYALDDKTRAKLVMEKCAGVKGGNPCELVYNFEKCIDDWDIE